jgi:hypothetical protein
MRFQAFSYGSMGDMSNQYRLTSGCDGSRGPESSDRAPTISSDDPKFPHVLIPATEPDTTVDMYLAKIMEMGFILVL